MPRVRLTRLALDHRDAPQNDVGAEELVHPGQQEGRRRDVEEEGFEYRSGFEPVGWGRVPIEAPQLLRTLMKQEGVVSRCELRAGVHLDTGYVTDLCLTGQFNDCVFYEDAAD